MLRDLPISARYFWRDTVEEFVQQEVLDRFYDDANPRPLPANEVLVLALNEIAAERRYGFFFHLPNRMSWTRNNFNPKTRTPPKQGYVIKAPYMLLLTILRACFPSLVYMRFAWSEAGHAKFIKSSHRSRYLASDFLLNPPPSQTPTFCFQVAADARYPLYSTSSHASYVILQVASPAAFYLLSARDSDALIGQWPLGKRTPAGADPAQRLNTAPWVWKPDSASKSTEAAILDGFKHSNLRSLYDAIASACFQPSETPVLTAADISRMTPRPANPEMGMPLGTPLANEVESGELDASGPKSRRGGRQKKGPRKSETLEDMAHHITGEM